MKPAASVVPRPHASTLLVVVLASTALAAAAGCGGAVSDRSVAADAGGASTGDDAEQTTTSAPPAAAPPPAAPPIVRSCTTETDCTVVFSGDVCACSCEVEAIATVSLSAYQTARDAAEAASCSGKRALCGPCPQVLAACVEGTCRLAR